MTEKKERQQDWMVFRPNKEQLKNIAVLHAQLQKIAKAKQAGKLSSKTAIDRAVKAVRSCSGTKQTFNSSGPLQRLERICSNGWIMEASDYLPIWYPDLTQLEQELRKQKRS
ncbi:hypothetical protein [Bifidobacterium sp. SO1]|uniref:hypothetical protein n=1 Tax=Bifidobacterium sp. SO1 TaxID=2809029 RepID=UPI001BDD74A3|nr:hypothetical protein [Bifidobacterium sp. SO1]MBT1162154.1 hypothetical protein [Bifidobacterium sp. SO1]